VEALESEPNVALACRTLGVARSSAYDERKANPVFAAAWDQAIDKALDEAEAELHRRAVEGVKRPVYQNGKLVGYTQEYSDTLLIFMLKCRRPERYRDRMEVTTKDGDIDSAIERGLADLAARGKAADAEAPAGDAGAGPAAQAVA